MTANPQDQSKFLPISYAMDDYKLSERDIATAAFKGEISLYVYDGNLKRVKPIGPGNVETFYFFGKIEAPKFTRTTSEQLKGFRLVGATLAARNPYRKDLDKTNILVNIQEIRNIFPSTELKNTPPLLALANQCWDVLFSENVNFFNVNLKDTIKEKLKELKSDLSATELEELTKTIRPDNFTIGGNRPKKEDTGISGKNESDYPFYSKELSDANYIWNQICLRKDEKRTKVIGELLRKASTGKEKIRLNLILTS